MEVHSWGKSCVYIYIWVNCNNFTNLNLAAIKGDDFPNINHDFQGSGEQGSLVIKFTHINIYIYIHTYIYKYTYIYTRIGSSNAMFDWIDDYWGGVFYAI